MLTEVHIHLNILENSFAISTKTEHTIPYDLIAKIHAQEYSL